MRMICSIATAVSLLAPAASAQSALGTGNVSCAQYLKAARTSDILYHQGANWLLGYVSGMNAALRAANAAPVAVSSDQVLKSAADYCAGNATATLASAAAAWSAQAPKADAPPAAEVPRDRRWILDLNDMPKQPGGRRP